VDTRFAIAVQHGRDGGRRLEQWLKVEGSRQIKAKHAIRDRLAVIARHDPDDPFRPAAADEQNRQSQHTALQVPEHVKALTSQITDPAPMM
jgi:hypothetical protein